MLLFVFLVIGAITAGAVVIHAARTAGITNIKHEARQAVEAAFRANPTTPLTFEGISRTTHVFRTDIMSVLDDMVAEKLLRPHYQGLDKVYVMTDQGRQAIL